MNGTRRVKNQIHGFFFFFFAQGNAALLLANLEKEKELLRIFLRVSQMENAVLRRMNLNSFLMVSYNASTSCFHDMTYHGHTVSKDE